MSSPATYTPAPRAGAGLEALAKIAAEAARCGAAVALAWQARGPDLVVDEKAAPDDLVSQADSEVEGVIRAVLSATRPHDAVLGEETGSTSGTSGVRWVVDPIDGTTNFLYGRADWAVSVAALDERTGDVLAGVVLEPAVARTTVAWRGGGAWADGRRLRCPRTDDLSRTLVDVNFGRPAQRPQARDTLAALLPAVRDVRRGGSAAASLAQVATGRVDAYWGPGLQPWDAAAGVLIVNEAGGTVGDLSGPTDGAWPDSGDVLATRPGLFDGMRGLLTPRV